VIRIIIQYAQIAIHENGIQKNHAKSFVKTDEHESCVFISQIKELTSFA
jgi:hypothetical protein